MIHRVDINSSSWVNTIWTQTVEPNYNNYLASETIPYVNSSPIPENKWAQVFTNPDTAYPNVNDFINNQAVPAIQSGVGMVVIDGLTYANRNYYENFAHEMLNVQNRLNLSTNSWGCLVKPITSYDNIVGALQAFINAEANLLLEFYVSYQEYCRSDTTYAARDKWYRTVVLGNGTTSQKLKYVHGLIPAGKNPYIAPVLAITSSWTDPSVSLGTGGVGTYPSPNIMVDREMFNLTNIGEPYVSDHVFHGGLYNPGGIGSDIWEDSELNNLPSNYAQSFCDSWNYYAKEKHTSTRLGIPSCSLQSTTPPGQVIQPTGNPFPTGNPRTKPQLGDQSNQIEKTSGTAVLYRSIEKSSGTFYSYDTSSATADPLSYYALFVTQVTYGYSVTGQNEYSKYYNRFYPTSGVIKDAQVSCIATDEREYEDIMGWIRQAQTDLARGYIDYMGLYIPATGVSAAGFISNVQFSLGNVSGGSANNPIPVAIPFNFTFTYITDFSDPNESTDSPDPDVNFNPNSFWSAAYNNYVNNIPADQIVSTTYSAKPTRTQVALANAGLTNMTINPTTGLIMDDTTGVTE